MKSFHYVIKTELGIHARPAGMLVKEAKNYESILTIEKGEKLVDLTKLMALMSLCVKCSDEVIISANGIDEDAAIEKMKELFVENL